MAICTRCAKQFMRKGGSEKLCDECFYKSRNWVGRGKYKNMEKKY